MGLSNFKFRGTQRIKSEGHLQFYFCNFVGVYEELCINEPLEVRRFEFLTLNALLIQRIWRGFHCRKGKIGEGSTVEKVRLEKVPL